MHALSRSLATLLLALVTLSPGLAEAGGKGTKRSVERFYEEAAGTIATVEFVQQFVAGGVKQQTRGYTDGFVISSDGLVLISGRVRFPQRGGSGRISGGSRPELSSFRLRFSDGREFDAVVVAFEADLNLGLLRITDVPEGGMPHVRFRRGFRARIGMGLRSMTLYGQNYGHQPVLSPVSVNALLDTPQEVWSLSGASSSLLGAPLWDARGRVVGVIAQVPMSPWAGRQVVPDLSGPVGLSYGRFADWIEEAVAHEAEGAEQAGQSGPTKRDDSAWLGVMFQALDKDLAEHLEISPGGGVVITRVVPSSPAAAAGLQPLDILVELESERIAVLQDSDSTLFSRRIRSYPSGSKLRMTREQPGGARDEVVIETVPTPTSNLHAERRQDESFDLTVRELTLDTTLGHRLEPGTPGVVVDGVTRAGWAGLAGIKVGQIIQRVGDTDVDDLDGFSAVMATIAEERPEKVMFFIRTGRSTRFLVAEPDWSELGAEP